MSTKPEITRTETCDFIALDTIIANAKILQLPDEHLTACIAYRKLRNTDDTVTVTYKRNDGRLCAQGTALQNLPRKIRHTISGCLYDDIDMVNAGPTIIYYMAKKEKFVCEYLKSYVHNRDITLKSINKDYDKAKKIINTLLFGGNLREDAVAFERNFSNEMKQLHSNFSKLYKDEYAEHKEAKISQGITYNHRGSFFSKLYHKAENEVLSCMYKFLGSHKNVSFQFDGLAIEKDSDRDYDTLLPECENKIKEMTGIIIKLKVKDMNDGYNLMNLSSVLPDNKNKQDKIIKPILLPESTEEFNLKIDSMDDTQQKAAAEFTEYIRHGLMSLYANSECDEWKQVAHGLYEKFGSKGMGLFMTFSKLGNYKHTNNDADECKQFYKDLKTAIKIKKYTFNSIRALAKKINTKLYFKIYKMHQTSGGVKQYAETDQEAGTHIYEMLKDELISCRGQLFLNHGNIWSNDDVFIKSYLTDFIMKAPIYKHNKDADIQFWANFSPAEKLVKVVFNQVNLTPTNDIYTKFHTTTKNRLCFIDGVLDFKTRKFYTWEEVNFEYYSCVSINREYKEYFNNPNHEVIEEIKTKIYGNMFGDNTDKALQFLSRGITGNSEDKNVMTYCGNRDCGKGVMYDNLSYGFGSYVKAFELGNILYNRKTSGVENVDCSKKLYWLMDLEFTRLGISQEIPDHNTDLKINSKMLKKIAGGGDTIVARRNYDRVDTHFTLDTTLVMMGNNSLQFDNEDCKEHVLEFNSVNQFKTKDEIKALIENNTDEAQMKRYKVKDAKIKDKTKTTEWSNAIVYLLFQNFKNTPVEIVKEIDIEDESLLGRMKEVLIITNDEKNISSCDEVNTALRGFDKKKIEIELKAMNVFKKKCKGGGYRNIWCYYGLTLIKDEDELE